MADKSKVTQEQLISAMQRLDLHDGDVLIVHDPDLTPRLTALRLRSITFPVPIVVAAEGFLTKVSIEDLRKIVREYDDRNTPETPSTVERGANSAPDYSTW